MAAGADGDGAERWALTASPAQRGRDSGQSSASSPSPEPPGKTQRPGISPRPHSSDS